MNIIVETPKKGELIIVKCPKCQSENLEVLDIVNLEMKMMCKDCKKVWWEK